MEDENIKVRAIHGDFKGNSKDICISLSDLIRKYGNQLNYKERDGSQLETDLTDCVAYPTFLFLGTSFSESHIGRIVDIVNYKTEHYAVLAQETRDDINENHKVIYRAGKFNVPAENIFFYPQINGKHVLLVDLLHQLSRDLESTVWNADLKPELKQLRDSLYPSDAIVNEGVLDQAITWLKDQDSLRILTIELSDEASFNVEKGELNCNRVICYLYRLFERIANEFTRPQWSTCIISDSVNMDDINPLGDSIYYYFEEVGEHTARRDSFQKIIEEGIQEFGGIRCRIIRICVGIIGKEVFDFNYAEEKVFEKYVKSIMSKQQQDFSAYSNSYSVFVTIYFRSVLLAFFRTYGMPTIRNDVIEREMEETNTNAKTLKKELK